MAATSTLKTILENLVEETGIGIVTSISASSSTTFALTTAGSPELGGPFSGKKIPIGSPIIITSETTGTGLTGDRAWVSDFNPSTQTVTFSPAITSETDATGAIIIYADSGIDDVDRLIEAISRALQNRCCRWMKVPLGYVPDGEYLGAVASFWTAAAGTASYASLVAPQLSGMALQLTHTSATNVVSNTIDARSSEVWEFETAIRSTTASGVTAGFVIRDITNSADITPTYEQGDGTTTSNAFETQRGTFTVPATCDQIAFRLTNDASGTVQMARIIAYPRDAMSFPFTNRVVAAERIGNFYYSRYGSSVSGPDERGYTDPITVGGRTAMLSNEGDHFVVSFNFSSFEPVYYDELVYGAALSAMSDTSVFPLDQIVKWSKFELFKTRYNRERIMLRRDGDGKPLPSIWRTAAREALREAQWSSYRPELKTLVGRV